MNSRRIAVIGGAVISQSALDILKAEFRVDFISIKEFEKKREFFFRSYKILWVHVETVLSEKDLNFLEEDSIIISTTTGLTHIPNQIITYLGPRLISLQGKTDFLRTITSTAELALTFILMSLTNVEKATNDVRKGNWDRISNIRFQQVSSADVGVIGYGRLGEMVAKRVRPICSRIIVWDTDESALKRAQQDGFATAKNLNELLSSCDVASIHVSAERGGSPIITNSSIANARPGLAIVNTSRGSLICEDSVILGIENQILQGYFADVLTCEEEGLPVQTSKIWRASQETNKIYLTPHIGGASKDAIEKCELYLLSRLRKIT